MANTKIKYLPTASLAQVSSSNNYFLYMSDLGTERDVKFKAKDFFTSVTSSGSGTSLISRSTLNSVSLKTLSAGTTTLNVSDGGKGLEVSLVETNVDLNNCNNTNAKFLKSVDLPVDTGTSILPIVNGGTGSSTQYASLNLITKRFN